MYFNFIVKLLRKHKTVILERIFEGGAALWVKNLAASTIINVFHIYEKECRNITLFVHRPIATIKDSFC